MAYIGLISDTHGYFDEKVRKFLEPVDVVWHAGDFGNEATLSEIATFKPLVCVHGNCDGYDVRDFARASQFFEQDGMTVLMTHIGGYPGNYDPSVRSTLFANPPQLFIAGHSHILKVKYDKTMVSTNRPQGMLHLNPGAAGLQGWHRDRTLMRITIDGDIFRDLEVITLSDPRKHE